MSIRPPGRQRKDGRQAGRRLDFRSSMRLLRRHIIRSVSGPFFFSLGACTGLLLVNQLAKRFGDLVGKDLPTRIIVEVLLLSIPFIIALTLPMAVLVAILYGYSQLGADNEITAMRANGISVGQMIRPALLAGLFLAALSFLFVDQVLPRTNARLGNLQRDIAEKRPAFQMREQAINALGHYFIRASRVYPGSGRMTDVQIFDHSLYDGRRIIYADSGQMSFDQRGVDLILTLHNGKVHDYKTTEISQLQVTRFDHNTIRVNAVQNLFQRDTLNFARGDREMTTCEMMDQVTVARRRSSRAVVTRQDQARIDLRGLMRVTHNGVTPTISDTGTVAHCGKWRTFERAFGRLLLPKTAEAQAASQVPVVPTLNDTTGRRAAASATQTPVLTSIAEITVTRDDERASRVQADKYLVEIHKKYSISVACFSFVVIGVAMALRFPRGGMGLVIGGGLLVFAIFYVCLVGGESLADRGFASPALAMWLPNILMLTAGVLGLIKVNREFGSTRGGDFADFMESLIRPFRFGKRAT